MATSLPKTNWELISELFIKAVSVQLDSSLAVITEVNIIEEENRKSLSLTVNNSFGVFFNEEQANTLTTQSVARYLETVASIKIN